VNNNLKEAANEILENANKAIDNINTESLERLLGSIINSKQVFVLGAGRSGLVLKAFAMRLVHLGIPAYVIGETITPRINDGDLLLIVSGTGETTSIVSSAQVIKNSGAYIGLITSYPDSTLGKMADVIVEVKGRTKYDSKSYTERQVTEKTEAINPMGTLFETASLIVLDSMIVCLMRKMERNEDFLADRHSKIV